MLSFIKILQRITGSLHKDLSTFIISRLVLLRVRNVSDKIVQKTRIYILFSASFSENLAVYEIMWKKGVQPCRSQMTIL